jgi:hypothetical protein
MGIVAAVQDVPGGIGLISIKPHMLTPTYHV